MPRQNQNSGDRMAGVSSDNFLPVFALHRHDGTPLGGPLLNGPYYLVDEVTGTRYKLIVHNGALGITVA